MTDNFDQTPLDEGMEEAGKAADGLYFTDQTRTYLHQTQKWMFFFAVLSFIWFGISILGMLIMGKNLLGDMSFMAGGSGYLMVFYGLLIIPTFLIALYEYRASAKLKEALEYEDNDALEDGFTNLKKYYRLKGWLIIAAIAAYILMIIFVGLTFRNY